MTRTNTRLSGEILKLAKNVQDLASAFNGNVHSILRQQRDDREQLHTFYGNMEKALAGLLGRMDALERNGLPKVDQPPLGEMKAVEPLPRFYVDEENPRTTVDWTNCPLSIGGGWWVRDRERKGGFPVDGFLTYFNPLPASTGAARAAAKEYCAWLNDMETKKS